MCCSDWVTNMVKLLESGDRLLMTALSMSLLPRPRYIVRPALASDRHQIHALLQTYHAPSPAGPAVHQTAPPKLRRTSPWLWFGSGWLLVLGLSGFGGTLAWSSLLPLLGLLLLPIGLAALAIQLNHWFRIQLIDWQHYWLIVDQGEAIACGKLIPVIGNLILCNVVVAPHRRQQGIGSQLVRSIVQSATRSPDIQLIVPIYLACLPERLSFYQRLGFAVVEPRSLHADLRQELGISRHSRLLPLRFVGPPFASRSLNNRLINPS